MKEQNKRLDSVGSHFSPVLLCFQNHKLRINLSELAARTTERRRRQANGTNTPNMTKPSPSARKSRQCLFLSYREKEVEEEGEVKLPKIL